MCYLQARQVTFSPLPMKKLGKKKVTFTRKKKQKQKQKTKGDIHLFGPLIKH